MVLRAYAASAKGVAGAESVTGFGVGAIIGVPLLRELDLKARRSTVRALPGLVIVTWGSIGPGTLVAARLGQVDLQALGVTGAALSGMVFFVKDAAAPIVAYAAPACAAVSSTCGSRRGRYGLGSGWPTAGWVRRWPAYSAACLRSSSYSPAHTERGAPPLPPADALPDALLGWDTTCRHRRQGAPRPLARRAAGTHTGRDAHRIHCCGAPAPARQPRGRRRPTGMPEPLTGAAIDPRERLIVALDVASADAARALVEQLGDHVVFYKVGLELAMAPGFLALVDWLKARRKKVFVDVKLFDVPATVAAAVRRLCARDIDFITVHGNQRIMAAAAEAKSGGAKILAVTALTSLDRGDLDDLGFACDIEALVLSRAKRALEAGCEGVVSSGLEVAALRAHAPDKLIAVTPGIRPVSNDETPPDDQKRVMTPSQAIAAGADYLVLGRPIRDAAVPAAVAAEIQQEIATVVTPNT